MSRWGWIALLSALAGCASNSSPQAVCQRRAYDDPVVKLMIMRQAGSPYLFNNNQALLRQAEHAATQRCLRGYGLAPPGGVEAPVPSQTHSLF